MLSAIWAVVKAGKIEPLEPGALPEGERVLVTFLPEDERAFWDQASRAPLDAIWDNPEDDVYAQLLEK